MSVRVAQMLEELVYVRFPYSTTQHHDDHRHAYAIARYLSLGAFAKRRGRQGAHRAVFFAAPAGTARQARATGSGPQPGAPGAGIAERAALWCAGAHRPRRAR